MLKINIKTGGAAYSDDDVLTTDNMVQSKGTNGEYSTLKETIEELERRLHNEKL